MRKFIIKALLFLLVFIVVTVIINGAYLLVITRTDWNFTKRIESIHWEDPDFDLLALGTSLADYGVDAELLTEGGIKSYNLALVGGSIQTSYIQLKEYLTKYEKVPHYVLLLVNSHLEEFNQDGIQPLVEFTMKGQRIDLKDVPVSKFQWQTTELFKKLFSSEYRSGYISFGQTRRKKVTPDHSDYQDLVLDLDKFESARYIADIALLCQERGIEFIVIDIPGVRETQNTSGIGPYTLTFDRGQTARLYNLNSREFCKFIDSEKDWSGLSHFNEVGAAKFSRELLKIIREDPRSVAQNQ